MAHDVSVELRKHFDRHPIDPDARPLIAEPTSAGELEPVLKDGARRALGPRELEYSLPSLSLGWAWQVAIVVPLGAFFTSFMTEAGKDAYKALKRLIHRLSIAAARRRGSTAPDDRTIILRDAGSGLTIMLEETLSDKAYQQLLTMTLPSLPHGYSLDRLLWFRGRWILQVSVPIPDHDNLDDEPSYGEATVPVLLVWQATHQRWTLRKEDSFTDILAMQLDFADDD